MRPFEPADLEACYAICLATGFEGGDASHLYRDPKMNDVQQRAQLDLMARLNGKHLQHSDDDTELAARHFRAVGYYLTGSALDETSGYAKGPSAAEPVSDAYVAEHCKSLIAAAPYFQRQHWDATFEYGLQAMMASLAADVATRS